MKTGRPIMYREEGVVYSEDIALCVIGRRENRYAREFVEYYKSIGFDKIFLCDNNRDGEEHFEEVLQDYIDDGFVQIINYRNIPGAQCQAYAAVYRKYGDKYQWMAFFDFDEYLTMVRDNDVHKLMERYEGHNCVFFNWMNYGDNGLVHDDGRKLQERFTQPLPDQYVQYDDILENDHIKCMVRGGVKNLCFFVCPHLPSSKIDCCDSLGNTCEQKPYQKQNYSVAYLKHYITKTIEEWASNKWQKGAGTHMDIEEFRFRYTGRFFKYNEWTPEKENVMRKLTGTPAFKPAKHRTVVIVNFNTQDLTDCAIRSLNKHTPGCDIKIFDNSNKQPFVNTFDNVEVIDNTKGQHIDFEKFISGFEDRAMDDTSKTCSNFGSAKHCKTIDICLDLFPQGFLLMDSDVLVKKDVTPFFNTSTPWSGIVDSRMSRWRITVPRVLPYICYLNAPLLRKHKIRYFNADKMYALTSREPDKAYDTGAWLNEACKNKKLEGDYLPIYDYIIHFDHGSWLEQNDSEWLEANRQYWE